MNWFFNLQRDILTCLVFCLEKLLPSTVLNHESQRVKRKHGMLTPTQCKQLWTPSYSFNCFVLWTFNFIPKTHWLLNLPITSAPSETNAYYKAKNSFTSWDCNKRIAYYHLVRKKYHSAVYYFIFRYTPAYACAWSQSETNVKSAKFKVDFYSMRDYSRP